MATSITEVITPTKAQEYLNKSGGNRNISKPVVESYAHSMKEGKWLLNGEPIVFDINGHLINGHHRLHACIKANVPFETFVVRGVSSQSFSTFDCGRHRTLGQLIGMQQIKHYNNVAATVSAYYRLHNGKGLGENNRERGKGTTNSDMIDFFNHDREGFVKAGAFGVEMKHKASLLDASIVGSVYYYLTKDGGYREEFVENFFSMVCSFDTCEITVIDMLRKRLIRDKTTNTTRTPRAIVYGFLVKTWNYYVENVTPKILKYAIEDEHIPEFILNNK